MATGILANGSTFRRGDGGTGPGAATETGRVATGNGVLGAVTVTSGAKVGAYTLRLLATGATAQFQVEDPDGFIIGLGNVASAFSAGGLAFTLADGGIDFVIGDKITITVTSTSAEVFATLLGVFDIAPGAPSAPQVDMSTLMSPRRENLGGLQATGTMSVKMNFVPGDAGQQAVEAEAGTNVERNYRLVFADPDDDKGYQFSLVCTAFGLDPVQVDGKWVATATFEVAEAPVYHDDFIP